jgi:hypothetical protein
VSLDEPAHGEACVALNELLDTALAAERRCVASSGRAHDPALKAELVLRAAEHAGDAERLHAALVFLRCTPHAPDVDAALNDPLWSTPPLSQPDDAALLRACIAEEVESVARFEAALQLSSLPEAVRATLELCRQSAQRREATLRRLLATGTPPLSV